MELKLYLKMQNSAIQIAALIKNLSISELNEMQKDAFPAFSKNPNTLLLSPTGSGKTIAFLLTIYKESSMHNISSFKGISNSN
jgi:Lhr-like helicase